MILHIKICYRTSFPGVTQNRDTIIKQAKKLYEMIVSGKAWPTLAGRCCNFSVDEQQYLLYCKTHLEEDR